MTTDEMQREMDDAWRRAAHLCLLLAVDQDPDGFMRELGRLANEEDQLFCAAVSGACARMVAELMEPHPIEARREVLMRTIAQHSTFDLSELDDPPASSS